MTLGIAVALLVLGVSCVWLGALTGHIHDGKRSRGLTIAEGLTWRASWTLMGLGWLGLSAIELLYGVPHALGVPPGAPTLAHIAWRLAWVSIIAFFPGLTAHIVLHARHEHHTGEAFYLHGGELS